jgi:predicted RNase H-like nuclease
MASTVPIDHRLRIDKIDEAAPLAFSFVATGPLHRGAPTPYRPIAGVEPYRRGWLIVMGKLQGVTMLPEPAVVMPSMLEILDYRPPFEVVALHSPIGLPDDARGGRACDRAARHLLGARRGAAIVSPPPRSVLHDDTGEGLSAVVRAQLPRIREVQRDVASYHQRSVFEVHPELGFYQLNHDTPLQHPKHTPKGIEERRALLEARMQGVERVLDRPPRGVGLAVLLDACVDLWTARRIAGRSMERLPEIPEWNADGLRMELVR